MSPEIQNRGTSGPKKGHVCPLKTFKKKTKEIAPVQCTAIFACFKAEYFIIFGNKLHWTLSSDIDC